MKISYAEHIIGPKGLRPIYNTQIK